MKLLLKPFLKLHLKMQRSASNLMSFPEAKKLIGPSLARGHQLPLAPHWKVGKVQYAHAEADI